MRKRTLRFGKGFRVAFGNRRSQAAEMVIPPGDAEGDTGNRHRGADQWLFVLAGAGVATINDKKYVLRKYALLLIERGDRHQVRNTGKRPLRMLNFYVPPAYTKSGNELPRGRR